MRNDVAVFAVAGFIDHALAILPGNRKPKAFDVFRVFRKKTLILYWLEKLQPIGRITHFNGVFRWLDFRGFL